MTKAVDWDVKNGTLRFSGYLVRAYSLTSLLEDSFVLPVFMYAISLPVIDNLLTVTLKKEKESMLIESAFHFSTTFSFFYINPFALSFMSCKKK